MSWGYRSLSTSEFGGLQSVQIIAKGKNKNHVLLNGATSVYREIVLEIKWDLEYSHFVYSRGIFWSLFFSHWSLKVVGLLVSTFILASLVGRWSHEWGWSCVVLGAVPGQQPPPPPPPQLESRQFVQVKSCILLQLLRVSTSPPSRFLGAPSEWARAGCPSSWSQDICTRYPRSQLRSSLVNTSLPHPRATPEPDPFGSGYSWTGDCHLFSPWNHWVTAQ